MERNTTFYKTGEFARKAKVSIRTIRYYDTQGLLKPSAMSEAGYRLYTDSDFARLQKIIALKYLGFSLEEITAICLKEDDQNYVSESLKIQQQLIKKKIAQLKQIDQLLKETSGLVEEYRETDWNSIIQLIHVLNMEKSLLKQYKNSENVKIRINLHKNYSNHPIEWYEWLYSKMNIKEHMRILEIGCGNGELWKVNQDNLPEHADIILSDISSGMIADAKENLKDLKNLSFQCFDCHTIPAAEDSYDIVIANHMLFYLKHIKKALREVDRVLNKEGVFYCATYGKDHMKEIQQLVNEFDSRIVLSNINLYEIFGLENGADILSKYFTQVEKVCYEDYLMVDRHEPLVDYILSCHGNQWDYIHGRYEEFKDFVQKKINRAGGLRITKKAGLYCCYKR